MTGGKPLKSPAPAENRRRIQFLNHVARIGGAERSLLDMANWLVRHDWEPSVVLPEPGELAGRLHATGVPVFTLKMRRIMRKNVLFRLAVLWAVMRITPRFRRLVRQQDVAILHANSNTAHLYAIPAAGLAAIPLVWHCRDMVDLGRVGRFMLRRATRVIAISRAVAGELGKYGATEEKVRIIYNGIDMSRFVIKGTGDEVRAKLGVAPNNFVVTMVAQLVPWKNHTLFLAAAERVATLVPSAVFLIVGDDRFGDHPSYTKHLATVARQKGIAGRTIFAGYVEDVAGILEASDVLVHPASREPFGRSIVEAMAMRRPVVAVRDGGPREIVRDEIDGLLVPPDNAEALAHAIVRIARAPDMARDMGIRGQERVAAAFDLDRQMSQIEAMYYELLALMPRPRDRLTQQA